MEQFFSSYAACFKKYAIFRGRTARREYVAFTLINIIASTILSQSSSLSALFALITIVPGIAVSVRRLHDLNKSGWLLLAPYALLFIALILFIPFHEEGGTTLTIGLAVIGGIFSLVLGIWMLFFKGTVGDNKYGSEQYPIPR